MIFWILYIYFYDILRVFVDIDIDFINYIKLERYKEVLKNRKVIKLDVLLYCFVYNNIIRDNTSLSISHDHK